MLCFAMTAYSFRYPLLIAYGVLLSIDELSIDSNTIQRSIHKSCLGRLRSSPLGRGTAKLELCNIGNYAYAVYVTVGTPGYGVWLEIDTGSADTWILTTECRSPSCQLRKRFDPEKISKSVKVSKERFNITYGQGVLVGGKVISDRICLAEDACFHSLLGAATEVSQRGMHSDGVMGLGFKSLSRLPGTLSHRSSDFQSIPSPDLRSIGVFGLRLGRLSFDTEDDEGGWMTVGYADTTIPGLLLPLVSQNSGYWMVQLEALEFVYFDKGAINETVPLAGKGAKAILDTGSTCILTSSQNFRSQLNRWYRLGLITNIGDHAITDCTKLASLPDLRLSFCANCTDRLLLTSEQYTVPFDPLDSCRRRVCIQHVDGLPFTVLGSAFLSNFHAVFNAKNRTVELISESNNVSLKHQTTKKEISVDQRREQSQFDEHLTCFAAAIAAFLLAMFR